MILELRAGSGRERDGGLWLQHYKSDIPLRPMSYQRLWYARLYLELELTSVSEICFVLCVFVCVFICYICCIFVCVCCVCVCVVCVMYLMEQLTFY